MQEMNNKLNKLFQYLEANPNDSFARFSIAQEYKKQGYIEKAQDYFQQLKKQDPDYIGTYYHLGKLFEEKGDDEQAAQVYKEGMAIANKIGDQHALNELKQAIQLLDTDDEGAFENDA